MERRIIHIISILFSCVVVSCTAEEVEEQSAEYALILSTEVSCVDTKADLLNSGSSIPDGKLTLYGWEDETYWIKGVEASFSSDKWTLPGDYKMSHSSNYSYLAYANFPSSGASISEPSTKDDCLTLTVTDITEAQNDVLLGRETVDSPTSGDVSLDFSHPFSSVSFKLGNSPQIKTVTAISLDGLIYSGKTALSQSSTESSGIMQYTWTDLGDANATLQVSGLNKKEGEEIATFVVIPQADLSINNAIVTLTYDETDDAGGKKGEKMVKVLNSGSWEAGYTTTYTLTKVGEISIQVSQTTIKNIQTNSKIYVRATITGAWYIDNKVVAPWVVSSGTFTSLPGSSWTNSGDFYYYNPALEYNDETSPLFSGYTPAAAPVAGASLKLEILVQAIPFDVNKTCQQAFEAL